VTAKAYDQVSVFDAARLFAQCEGFVPAPETAHAVKFVIDEAIRCKEAGEEKTILLNFTGHGLLDLKAYEEYLSGNLKPYHYSESEIKAGIEKLLRELPWIKDLPFLKE